MKINTTKYALMTAVAGLCLAGPAAAEVIFASADARSETDGAPLPIASSTTDLGIGPISTGRAFRSYLTFDLATATAVDPSGSVELTLFDTTAAGNPNEGNTSATAQVFTLFEVASDWDGAATNPDGTTLATVSITPSTGNHGGDLVFSSTTALVNAFNNAIGGELYLGIKSDKEGDNVRSFVFYGSAEDGAGNQPALNTVIPEPSSLALLGLGGLLIARRRHV